MWDEDYIVFIFNFVNKFLTPDGVMLLFHHNDTHILKEINSYMELQLLDLYEVGSWELSPLCKWRRPLHEGLGSTYLSFYTFMMFSIFMSWFFPCPNL
jgi:hypothetical protein